MDRDEAMLAELSLPDVEDARLEIHIVPVQCDHLADAHAGHGEESEHGREGETAEPLCDGRDRRRPTILDLFVGVDVRRWPLVAPG